MARPKSMRSALAGLARFVRVFAPHVRGQRAVIGGAMAALLIETLLRVLEPWPLKFVIDRVAARAEGRVSLPMLEQLDAGTLFAIAAVALALAIVGSVWFFRQPAFPASVAQDFRDYQSQKITLQLETSDVQELEEVVGLALAAASLFS